MAVSFQGKQAFQGLRRLRSAPAVLTNALILLLGLLLMTHGYLAPHRVAFVCGLLIAIAGVLVGILQVTVQTVESASR